MRHVVSNSNFYYVLQHVMFYLSLISDITIKTDINDQQLQICWYMKEQILQKTECFSCPDSLLLDLSPAQ